MNLRYYFSGKKDLFNGLAMETLEKEWAVYPVLHIDFSVSKYMTAEALSAVINYQLLQWEKLYGAKYVENSTTIQYKQERKLFSSENPSFSSNAQKIFPIEFVENNNIWEDEKAYEFGILNENKKNSPNDSKVKETVQSIIEEFFLTNPDILLYQCETGDSRQAMRARLFTRWFNEFDKRDRFCVKVSILRDEEVDNYIAIIVQKSNPKLTDILRDFDEFIGFFDTKPE
jgi:hypothetical protein